MNNQTTMCKDHLGNEFASMHKMCEHWNVPYVTFYTRRKKGWSIKDSLTSTKATNSKTCTDHKGNVFDSVISMCKHYGVSYVTFYQRKALGWSLAEALDASLRPAKVVEKKTEIIDNGTSTVINVPITDESIKEWLKSRPDIKESVESVIKDNKNIRSITVNQSSILDYLNKENNLDALTYWLTHNMNANKTADTMGIHRNTFCYRLNKLKIYGIDINSLEGISKLANILQYANENK